MNTIEAIVLTTFIALVGGFCFLAIVDTLKTDKEGVIRTDFDTKSVELFSSYDNEYSTIVNQSVLNISESEGDYSGVDAFYRSTAEDKGFIAKFNTIKNYIKNIPSVIKVTWYFVDGAVFNFILGLIIFVFSVFGIIALYKGFKGATN